MLSPVEPTLMVSSEGFTFVARCCMFASFFSTEFCPRPGVWPAPDLPSMSATSSSTRTTATGLQPKA